MFSAALIFAVIAVSSAYKEGPPVGKVSDICTHMTPNHDGAPPTTTTGIISLTPSQTCFKAGQSIRIAVATTKDTIEGFFIQARTAPFANATASHGVFRTYTKNTGLYKCFSSSSENAVGHKDDEIKEKTLNVYWRAPDSNLTQDILIGGTFVLHKKEFFINTYKTISYKADCQSVPTGETEEMNLGKNSGKNSGRSAKLASWILVSFFAIIKFL